MKKLSNWDARIGRRMRLRDLHILLAVVQYGSMAKAAARLNVTQPAISAAIATLEAALGVRLLERSRKGVEPTPYGAVLLKYGQVAIDDLRQGVKEIEFLADPAAGELRVGCTESIVNGLLTPIIKLLADRYPRVRLHVHQFAGPPDELAELEQRRLDLILSRQSLDWSSGRVSPALNVEELFEDRYCVVVGKQSPLARRARIELADLARERWIMGSVENPAVAGRSAQPANTRIHTALQQIFGNAGLQPPEFMILTHSLFLRTTLVSAGQYVSVIPATVLRLHADKLYELPISLPLPRWPVAIVTLKNRTPNPAARLFLECVREVTGSLANVDSSSGRKAGSNRTVRQRRKPLHR